ncbi:MAG: IS630 family transposase, partial [Colwellia sp.]|nr:IS630 family transposase [Colwellia sp.]
MKKIELTEEQKEALESRHKKSCGKRESDRIKAVLLRDENWST